MRQILLERGLPRPTRSGSSPPRARPARCCRTATARSPSRTPPPPTRAGSTSRCSPPGATTSRAQAPRFAEAGVTVVDNSSAWRMDPDVPLVVSEVNPHAIADARKGIIANPNCTTMAAMPVLKPLHDEAGLVRLIASTYQAVSGSGVAGVDELATQVEAAGDKARELSLRRLGDRLPGPGEVRSAPSPTTSSRSPARSSTTGSTRPTRRRSCATSRARSSTSPTCWSPASACACPSSPATRWRSTPSSPPRCRWTAPARSSASAPGVELSDIPTPLQAAGKDPSYVGRLRHDPGVPDERGLALFISNDNLRKGAALNTVQIAELIASAASADLSSTG